MENKYITPVHILPLPGIPSWPGIPAGPGYPGDPCGPCGPQPPLPGYIMMRNYDTVSSN